LLNERDGCGLLPDFTHGEVCEQQSPSSFSDLPENSDDEVDDERIERVGCLGCRRSPVFSVALRSLSAP